MSRNGSDGLLKFARVRSWEQGLRHLGNAVVQGLPQSNLPAIASLEIFEGLNQREWLL